MQNTNKFLKVVSVISWFGSVSCSLVLSQVGAASPSLDGGWEDKVGAFRACGSPRVGFCRRSGPFRGRGGSILSPLALSAGPDFDSLWLNHCQMSPSKPLPCATGTWAGLTPPFASWGECAFSPWQTVPLPLWVVPRGTNHSPGWAIQKPALAFYVQTLEREGISLFPGCEL